MPLSGRILVTGGLGFLGRAVLRRIRKENWNAEVTVYSRDETKQFEVQRRYPGARFILGDVRDQERLHAAMLGHDYVIHGGAVKYIPEAERNVFKAIDVNVHGSGQVVFAAMRAGIKAVIGISTDKACQPLNSYGMTKALMERMFPEADRLSDTRFATVRYGNVVGSTATVIPMFIRQATEDNCISLTDGNMTRFWLSVDKAIDLIVSAFDFCKEGKGGLTVIPACPSMTMGKLAGAVWTKVKGEWPMQTKIIGIRPGEKMHESLFNEQESPRIEIAAVEPGYYLLHSPLSVLSNPIKVQEYSSANALSVPIQRMIEMINDAAQSVDIKKEMQKMFEYEIFFDDMSVRSFHVFGNNIYQDTEWVKIFNGAILVFTAPYSRIRFISITEKIPVSMKVLVLGAKGMLGKAVVEEIDRRGWTNLIGLDNYRLISQDPDLVINCVGKIPSKSKSLEDMLQSNALFPLNMSKMAYAVGGVPFIHISTDCVFSGNKLLDSYLTSDRPDPADAYGSSKALGEYCTEYGAMVLRTSFVGFDHGLMNWLINQNHTKVQGWSSAFWSGSTVWEVAKQVLDIGFKPGIFHLATAKVWDKASVLDKLISVLDLDVVLEFVSEPYINQGLYPDYVLRDLDSPEVIEELLAHYHA